MNVIQECAQLFARQQCSRHFLDLNSDGEQKRHQWVPLFSTLSLRALVNAALVLWDFALRDPVANSHEQIYGVAVVQERKNFRCSQKHPPGPPEEPWGELRKLSKNVLRSNSTDVWGSNSRIFSLGKPPLLSVLVSDALMPLGHCSVTRPYRRRLQRAPIPSCEPFDLSENSDFPTRPWLDGLRNN